MFLTGNVRESLSFFFYPEVLLSFENFDFLGEIK